MYLDDRIIARQHAAGGLCALAHADAVQLRDGSSLQLHAVQANRLPMIMLRAVATTTGHLLLVDLTRMVPRLDAELRACPKRDMAGHVLYTLRGAFETGAQFNAAAQRSALGTWWPVGDAYTWHPAPRAVDGEVLRIAAAHVPEQASLWGAAC